MLFWSELLSLSTRELEQAIGRVAAEQQRRQDQNAAADPVRAGDSRVGDVGAQWRSW